jgi:mutator protein MutT
MPASRQGRITKLQLGRQFVGAIIEHPQKGFLLQQRDKHAPSFPLRWTLFGGGVMKNESPQKAIVRELAEEIGLNQQHIVSCRQIQRNFQANGAVQFIYHIQTTIEISRLELKEGKQLKYVKKQHLFKYRFAFNIKDVFQKFLNAIDMK